MVRGAEVLVKYITTDHSILLKICLFLGYESNVDVEMISLMSTNH